MDNNITLVIQILQQTINSNQIDAEKLDEAVDLLESVKVSLTDDEEIDNIDQIQDYLQYIMVVEEPLAAEETKAELNEIIEKLKQWPNR